MSKLPIHEVLEEVKNTLRANQTVILEAAPGAGKTTVVPISLLEEEWLRGKSILLLEPRRLAARNAASRMSNTLKEEVGGVVGYRIRFESKVSSRTRVEVVTEGIFTRRIQSDPELKNVGLVIFDEFHERNLQTDLGLALALEVQSALREDLKILVMSATLDGKMLSSFLSAPVVKSEGRAYPVDVRYTNASKDKLNVAILSAIKSIAEESYVNTSLDIYNSIPFNDKYIFDVVLRNLSFKNEKVKTKVDIAINLDEFEKRNMM